MAKYVLEHVTGEGLSVVLATDDDDRPAIPGYAEMKAEIRDLRALYVAGAEHTDDCDYQTLSGDLKCNCAGGRARAAASDSGTPKSEPGGTRQSKGENNE